MNTYFKHASICAQIFDEQITELILKTRQGKACRHFSYSNPSNPVKNLAIRLSPWYWLFPLIGRRQHALPVPFLGCQGGRYTSAQIQQVFTV